MPQHPTRNLRHAALFTLTLLVVNVIADGWTQRPTVLHHQLVLLPFTALFLGFVWSLLKPSPLPLGFTGKLWSVRRASALALAFQAAFFGLFLYECRHFASFGYAMHAAPAICFFALSVGALLWACFSPERPWIILGSALVSSAGGLLLAIAGFPLNYLRSDMLPVIFWADRSLFLGTDPYATLHVASRLYDFPYLPGMMLAFYSAVRLGFDPRVASLLYLSAMALVFFWAAKPARRAEVAALLALFLLCPFLQYRHELYLAPHWFTLAAAFVLMQRRRYFGAAIAFGISMATYQFSWIIFPFFLLNGWRRGGWREASRLAATAVTASLLLVGPFLASASRQIGRNTVGQWGHRAGHALAAPMNLSFWATYLIHPDQLLRLQAALMVVTFGYCALRGRCADLEDTLRWMIVALTAFVLLNVLVDGYFFLMLLVPMLAFTCVASGWWAEPLVGHLPRTAAPGT